MAPKTYSPKVLKEQWVNISALVCMERVMGGYLNKLAASEKNETATLKPDYKN